jgi:metal-responsive CopG/Arc/MetJ family transcriptional regulator
MSRDIVEILDALVELNIFKSRSEAVSAFVEQAIDARGPMFEEIRHKRVRSANYVILQNAIHMLHSGKARNNLCNKYHKIRFFSYHPEFLDC